MDWTLKTLIPEHFYFTNFNQLCSWINTHYDLILESGQVYSMYIEDLDETYVAFGDGTTIFGKLTKWSKWNIDDKGEKLSDIQTDIV